MTTPRMPTEHCSEIASLLQVHDILPSLHGSRHHVSRMLMPFGPMAILHLVLHRPREILPRRLKSSD